MNIGISSTLALNNGKTIPVLGFGTYQMHESSEAEPSVLAALEAGYRHIDTAQMYENEEAIGRAIKKCGIPREEIFITTKLYELDPLHPEIALQECLKRLDLQYVDLCLLHWPLPDRIKAWENFASLIKAGLTKSIGVSNFTVKHLKELLSSSGAVPQVNQIECSPFLMQQEVRKHCAEHDIIVEAYSPLTRGHQLDNPEVAKIAKARGKSPAQILIRWGLQNSLVVLPKSSKPKRIIENADVFDFTLTEDEIDSLNSLNEDKHYCWDPSDA